MVVEMMLVWIVLESGSTTSSSSSKRPRIDQLPAANLDADDPLDDDVSVYTVLAIWNTLDEMWHYRLNTNELGLQHLLTFLITILQFRSFKKYKCIIHLLVVYYYSQSSLCIVKHVENILKERKTNQELADWQTTSCIGARHMLHFIHQVAALFCVKWRHGRRLEIVSSYQKSNSVDQCIFSRTTILPNFTPIPVVTKEL